NLLHKVRHDVAHVQSPSLWHHFSISHPPWHKLGFAGEYPVFEPDEA
ncbi:unnamed protein product, partial [marine sediment metagenome]